MYRHLKMLELQISRTTEASARAWIDTFFFRAITMVPPTQRMVLNMEYTVSRTTICPQSFTTISGRTDYKAIIAKPGVAKHPNLEPSEIYTLRFLRGGRQIWRTGTARSSSGRTDIQVHEDNADILRGALTNGREWIFLIVFCKKDSDGATYKESYDILHMAKHSPPNIVKPKPDLIAGILSYWIGHSFDDISADDWFVDYEE